MQASIFGAYPKPGKIGRVVAGRASSIKMVGMAEKGAPISLNGVAIHPDCWCLPVLSSFCTRKFRRWQNVPSGTSSPGLSGQSPESCKMVCVCACMRACVCLSVSVCLSVIRNISSAAFLNRARLLQLLISNQVVHHQYLEM